MYQPLNKRTKLDQSVVKFSAGEVKMFEATTSAIGLRANHKETSITEVTKAEKVAQTELVGKAFTEIITCEPVCKVDKSTVCLESFQIKLNPEWSTTAVGRCKGLINSEKTACFVICNLQALLHIPVVSNYLTDNHYELCHQLPCKFQFCLLCAMKDLARRLRGLDDGDSVVDVVGGDSFDLNTSYIYFNVDEEFYEEVVLSEADISLASLGSGVSKHTQNPTENRKSITDDTVDISGDFIMNDQTRRLAVAMNYESEEESDLNYFMDEIFIDEGAEKNGNADESLDPKGVLCSIKNNCTDINISQQGCAQDSFEHIINECERASETSTLSRIFKRSEIVKRVCASGCKSSETTECNPILPWSLTVNIEGYYDAEDVNFEERIQFSKLSECLDGYYAANKLNGYVSACCNQSATMERSLESTPEALVIHLQRVKIVADDFGSISEQKIDHKVDFPTLLEMSSYTSGNKTAFCVASVL